MKPKSPSSQKQGDFLYQDLLELLNPKTPLLLLAKKMPWEIFEREFAPLYADFSRPGKPIRLMVGLLLLKHESCGRKAAYYPLCALGNNKP